jgi:hypothetical protein
MFLSRTWAHLPWGTHVLDLFALGNNVSLKDFGPFAQRKLQLPFSSRKLRKLPILPSKVASLSIFEKTCL